MHVLGIVGSRRKVGNAEILVKEALVGSKQEGAEVSLIRASDMNVAECNGCMACLVREQPCALKDDMNWFRDELEKCDCLVMGAPSYHFLPPAALLLIEDRVHGMLLKMTRTRKAVSIGTAAFHRKAGAVIPVLNHFIEFLGFEITGSLLAASAGPGEVLLPERHDIIEVANQLGRDVVRAQKGDKNQLSVYAGHLTVFDPTKNADQLYTAKNVCPICFGDTFIFSGPDQVTCRFCYDVTAKIVKTNGKMELQFENVSEEEVRERRNEHFSHFIQPTGDSYSKRIGEIQALRAPYRTLDIPWLTPSSKQ